MCRSALPEGCCYCPPGTVVAGALELDDLLVVVVVVVVDVVVVVLLGVVFGGSTTFDVAALGVDRVVVDSVVSSWVGSV
jgi:hypothetical protein